MAATISPATERLITTIFISTVLHAVLVFGISFVLPESKPRKNVSMEVILVQKTSEKKPEKADFLAQATQEGGGEQEEAHRPTSPTPAPFPDPEPKPISTPPPSEAASKPKPTQVAQISAPNPSEHKIAPEQNQDAPQEEGEVGEGKQEINTPDMSALTLINNARASVASIQAELDKKFVAYSKRPRHKFISASTQEYKFASYMDAWRQKVEKIGTLNFPKEAQKKNISGKLTLDVALNKDGTIRSLKILKASKYAILDKAAVRIVRMSAPFAPFPRNISKDIDILHITRTWVFEYGTVTSR
ncbi:TonB family protein [Candidatus Albibeggiatoa sp. nov. NOAA]|uniref:energy transducer TonB n=1 Tax=Candidatus Albibeggiatoa sp. nov. NOAA TaxID=3162724 RepID=UPI0032F3315F|nr:TonB family protein [Thiotrichaceae bacterium]